MHAQGRQLSIHVAAAAAAWQLCSSPPLFPHGPQGVTLQLLMGSALMRRLPLPAHAFWGAMYLLP